MYLTVDSLIEINDIINGSNITLRKFNKLTLRKVNMDLIKRI